MKRTTACLVVHPRSGRNLARVPDVVRVLEAGGWTTDVVVKEASGQTMPLAVRAAEAGYDFVVAYGGDGTLNHVVNGVRLHAGARPAAVGVIPGGTVNVWAAEVGIPTDPVRAAHALVESDVRTVDLGHVGVESLTAAGRSTAIDPEAGSARGVRRHFLLMAGLGFDAALMARTPRALKHRLGVAAVALTALRMLPALRTFPLDVRNGDSGAVVWQERALQFVVGNTRRYGNVARMTPDALIDNGSLDVALITARHPFSTLAQVLALLARGRPVRGVASRGTRFDVSAPASVALQVDGSAVRLATYLGSEAQDALAGAGNASGVTVRYRFDAVPSALRIAVPHAYAGPLFRNPG